MEKKLKMSFKPETDPMPEPTENEPARSKFIPAVE